MNRQSSLQRTVQAVCIVGISISASAQEDTHPKPPEYGRQPSPVLEVQDISKEINEGHKGYPSKGRRIGTPTDIEWDLGNSFPKKDSLLELILHTRQDHSHEKQ